LWKSPKHGLQGDYCWCDRKLHAIRSVSYLLFMNSVALVWSALDISVIFVSHGIVIAFDYICCYWFRLCCCCCVFLYTSVKNFEMLELMKYLRSHWTSVSWRITTQKLDLRRAESFLTDRSVHRSINMCMSRVKYE
jgi:uncharacterized Fe-S cluster-containing MiaB family protein